MANVMLYNVIVMGFSFMFLFTAFQTSSGIEQTVIESIDYDNKTSEHFGGSGYYSQAIIYGVFAFSNWLAPSVVSLIGPRVTMLVSALVYTGFIAIFLQLKIWTLYMMSVFLGFAAACIWTAQGNFLTINSTSETVGRNSGIFWAMLQCSLLFGNLFIFFEIGQTNTTHIEASQRQTIFIVLTSVSGIGVLMFLLLRNPKQYQDNSNQDIQVVSQDAEVKRGPLEALISAFKLLKKPHMLLLMVCFFYTGLELTFFSGVYGTSVGNTHLFGLKSKSYVALCGIFIGCGEIFGGATFGLLGNRTNKFGRDPIVLLGFITHIIAFYFCFINLPSEAPIKDVDVQGYFPPKLALALVTAFLLGFGDSCFNTQVYSILGYLFSKDSSPAFALFKFTQSLAAAIAFFYANQLMLQWQLLILVVFSVLGTLSFAMVEWTASRKFREGYESI
ncbi:UNC93-like protein MFSD11 [Asterias amurensis]|uniref:UNC93-like protein MFSD11 n=1 Tax=Asterias amurensis TaxID=7602 RepID=UPI003AB49101